MSLSIESWLHSQWSKRGTFAVLLSPLSLVYMAAARIKKARATPVTLPVPVVVVGNIYVGGTGKTPITIELVRQLKNNNFVPGVISRGYGRSAQSVQLVDRDSPVEYVGDEPLLIAQNAHCPVAVGRDRIAAAQLLLKEHPEVNVIVSDDGLQHTRLARDVELAVIGARGLGNGWTLPAGPLRETPDRLDSVDAIILNATNEVIASRTQRFAATTQTGDAIQIFTGNRVDIDSLAGEINASHKKVVAAAGIAAPERFFSMLRAHDIKCATLDLPDHYDYSENPFKHWACDIILVTGKDAVKVMQNPDLMHDERIWYVDLEMQLDPYLVEFVCERVREVAKEKKIACPDPAEEITH